MEEVGALRLNDENNNGNNEGGDELWFTANLVILNYLLWLFYVFSRIFIGFLFVRIKRDPLKSTLTAYLTRMQP